MCPSDNKYPSDNNQGSLSRNPSSVQNNSAGPGVRRKLCALPKRLTYAALVDRQLRETEITEFMVRRACEEMDCMQQFPFAAS